MDRRRGGGRSAAGLAIAAVALLLTGYVLPADRVLKEIARSRDRVSPVRIRVEVERAGTDRPASLRVEVHPKGGWRIQSDDGSRWVGRGPSLIEGPPDAPPGGLGAAWLILISEEGKLRSYLARLGVNLDRNQLGRCGDDDCFVFGGRDGAAQLWVDKDRLEVRKLRDRKGQEVEFDGYRGGIGPVRVPTIIRVLDPLGTIGEAAVVEFEEAPELRDEPELGG
jgi:hypothetical protein